ncbi:polysaccharide deacetylase family protein [Pararobbsia silviterrae]|uniref:NodB homology domain-containing protein n=1 Tax=Pararobbsia silviterrae TaxID=1792498 RepID=A0A494Y7Y9_9BURK|nr:polysaccharide deacetylase family protein [Pararobbsia silviterrae]RKP56426.1 hypothetical protein D7S86_08520 [Pararobbsia silviterrae]
MALRQKITNLITRKLPYKWVSSRLERPLASITFDDFPRSAWSVAGPILADYDSRGTYYAAGRFAGQTEDGIEYFRPDDLGGILAAGHEIGCHSFGHRRASGMSAAQLRDEKRENAAFFEATVGNGRVASYAYPYGDVGPRSKGVIAREYAIARGIRPGINAGRVDLAQVLSVPIEARRWRPDEIGQWIEEAKRKNGWLVFFTHDVSEQPSPFGCTPEMLVEVLEGLKRAGIASVPVKHAVAELTFGGGAGHA